MEKKFTFAIVEIEKIIFFLSTNQLKLFPHSQLEKVGWAKDTFDSLDLNDSRALGPSFGVKKNYYRAFYCWSSGHRRIAVAAGVDVSGTQRHLVQH
jgi:hypothetical protein